MSLGDFWHNANQMIACDYAARWQALPNAQATIYTLLITARRGQVCGFCNVTANDIKSQPEIFNFSSIEHTTFFGAVEVISIFFFVQIKIQHKNMWNCKNGSSRNDSNASFISVLHGTQTKIRFGRDVFLNTVL